MSYSNVDLAKDYADYLFAERTLRQIAEGKTTLRLNELLYIYVAGNKAIESIKKNAESVDQRVLEVGNFNGNLESLASKVLVGSKSKRE